MPDQILQNEATAVLRETDLVITDAGGTPLAGLDQTKVTIKIAKAGTNLVASTATLVEVTGGADTDGLYRLRFPAGEVDTVGGLMFEITSGTSTIKTLKGSIPVISALRTVDVTDAYLTSAKLAADFLSAAAVSAAAVTKIQVGLATDAAVQTVLGLHRRNSLLDGGSGAASVVYDAFHMMTSARLRVFASAGAAAAAVAGHADNADSEIQRYRITGVGNGSGLMSTFKMVQEL